MKLFECQHCGQLLYFENTRCERCRHVLGYMPDRTVLSALAHESGDCWRSLAVSAESFRFCANAAYGACNWLMPAHAAQTFCQACRLNRTIPNLDTPGHLLRWQRLEAAKHRLIYGILRLGLPLTSKAEDPQAGLAFDFLADSGPAFRESPLVVTGHSLGLITINIAEADDVEREHHRQDMAEPYRTLLGHFRHEVGHYYWERLVRAGPWLEPFRALFGDERQDYGARLAAHYDEGPLPDWSQRFVSAYAGCHPWEDWAETWAHYLHIVDTLETAGAFGVRVHPNAGRDRALAMEVDFDPYREDDFDVLVQAWLPLTYALNSLSHSMGHPAFYPFVLVPKVMQKLRFVHDLIGRSPARADRSAPPERPR
jgi:hypothetical protein